MFLVCVCVCVCAAALEFPPPPPIAAISVHKHKYIEQSQLIAYRLDKKRSLIIECDIVHMKENIFFFIYTILTGKERRNIMEDCGGTRRTSFAFPEFRCYLNRVLPSTNEELPQHSPSIDFRVSLWTPQLHCTKNHTHRIISSVLVH